MARGLFVAIAVGSVILPSAIYSGRPEIRSSHAVHSTLSFQAASKPSYVGVAGCAAMACHGGTRPNERSEYTIWIQRDRHARAYQTLYGERSLRIGKNLGIERPEQEATCLVCHGTAVGASRGPKFAIEDGVGCEACHGPAERWLAPHSKPDWKERRSSTSLAELGMTDTKDVVVRADGCVKCHVGASGMDVNHDLIAAGHPPLLFELDAYTANMPPHWRETPDKPATFGAVAWAVGQAVSLRQSLELLIDRAGRSTWPEFAEFECYSCHHELRRNDAPSNRAAPDRRPGSPVWSRPQPIRAIGSAIEPGETRVEPDELVNLRRTLSQLEASTPDVVQQAELARVSAQHWTEVVSQTDWSPDRLRAVVRKLTVPPATGSLDYATAASITMALGAIIEAIVRTEPNAADGWSSKVRPLVDRLYDDVQDPSKFERPVFARDLQTLRNALAR